METTKCTFAEVDNLLKSGFMPWDLEITDHNPRPAADTDLIPWESETKSGEELTALGVAAFGTPANAPETTTPSNDTTMNETTNNVQEYTHAAACLDIYLMNESEIYDRYTVPAIELVASTIKALADLNPGYAMECAKGDALKGQNVAMALYHAKRLVQKHDHMTPTASDIAAVKANYVDYIIECAQYKVNNA